MLCAAFGLALLPEGPGAVVIHASTDPTWLDGLARTKGAQGVLEDAGYKTVVRSVTGATQ